MRRNPPQQNRGTALADCLRTCLLSMICVSALWASSARAQSRHFYRARFETEALELEVPGEIELDGQSGGYYGDGPDQSRLLLHDVEIDIGLTTWLEIDLDFALSLTQLESAHQLAGDPLWLAARFAAVNWRDDETDAAFGIGLQVGPRLPGVNTPHGVGFEGLFLIGGGTRKLHLVANLGALIDYHQDPGLLYGVDAEYELGEHWSVLSNFAAAYYFGQDPQQLLIDVGCEYRPTQRLAISLLAIAGLVRGDRAGGLLGVSYSFQAWGHRRSGAGVQAPQPN